MHKFLAIDPGSRIMGYAAVSWSPSGELKLSDYGVFRVGKKLSFAQRLTSFRQQMNEVILLQKPTHVVVEKIFLGKNAESAFKLGHVRGVCLELAVEAGAEVFEYAARKVKKSVTGSGAASKEQVQFAAQTLLGVPGPMPLDASDAMALAICHGREYEVKQRMEQQLRDLENQL